MRGPQQLWHVGSAVVARGPQSAGSAVVAHGFSCSAAYGIFPDQGSNPCPLHGQADSQPLRHQGSPFWIINSNSGVLYGTFWLDKTVVLINILDKLLYYADDYLGYRPNEHTFDKPTVDLKHMPDTFAR